MLKFPQLQLLFACQHFISKVHQISKDCRQVLHSVQNSNASSHKTIAQGKLKTIIRFSFQLQLNLENNENKLSFMLGLIDCSNLLFCIFTFTSGGMLLLCNQIWIWERICNLSKKILLLQFTAIKIYEKHTVLQVLSLQRGESYHSTLPIFFSESFILFGKLKLSIFCQHKLLYKYC